jgi:hypothetical protein
LLKNQKEGILQKIFIPAKTLDIVLIITRIIRRMGFKRSLLGVGIGSVYFTSVIFANTANKLVIFKVKTEQSATFSTTGDTEGRFLSERLKASKPL